MEVDQEYTVCRSQPSQMHRVSAVQAPLAHMSLDNCTRLLLWAIGVETYLRSEQCNHLCRDSWQPVQFARFSVVLAAHKFCLTGPYRCLQLDSRLCISVEVRPPRTISDLLLVPQEPGELAWLYRSTGNIGSCRRSSQHMIGIPAWWNDPSYDKLIRLNRSLQRHHAACADVFGVVSSRSNHARPD